MPDEGAPRTKLMLVDDQKQLQDFSWGNGYCVQEYRWGKRILCSTDGDRMEFFLRLVSRNPGPYGLTYILEDNDRTPDFRRGRYIANAPMTFDQLKYFTDEFHEFLCEDGRHHLMVHCKATGGAVIYDQHDYYYVYGQLDALEIELSREGFEPRGYELAIHGHLINQDPAELHRLMQFRPWMWRELEATDTSREQVGLWQYIKMKSRAKWYDWTRKAPD